MLQANAAEGVHRIEDAHTNWYLIEEAGDLTVVDAGFPSSWKSLQDALRQLGRSANDVRAVVLTHGHFDHVGFAERARRDLGVPVYAHEREIPLVRHPWRYDHERSRLPYLRNSAFVKIFAAMTAAGAPVVKGVHEVRPFGEGETLDVPGRPRVVFTPGHTHGHCALHLRDRNAVIAGDAIVLLDPYTGEQGPKIVAGAATADSATNLASLGALATTDASTVLTGHGEPWTGGAARAVELARAAGPS